MKFNEALKELKSGKSRKFILSGDESYLMDCFIKGALSLKPENTPYHYYPGEEAQALDTLYSSSLFDEDQVVILNYYDEMKAKGFKEVVARFNGSLFITLSPEANLKTTSFTDIAGQLTHVQCTRMSEYNQDYPLWVINKGSERGYTFLEDAETLLYKKIGPDMGLLIKELEKLFYYKEKSKTITPEDVKKVVSLSAEASNFDFFDALLRRNIPQALKILDPIIDSGEDFEGLVAFLEINFEKLYKILILNAEKSSPESIGSIVGMPPYFVRSKYLPRALSFGLDKIGDIIGQLVELEAKIRTSNIRKALFNKFIFSFI